MPNREDELSTPRPISQVNAHRPPQNRRRVWRACDLCRKKKVKCDGSDPCKPCLGHGVECTYPDPTTARSQLDVQNTESFQNRLQSLEEMLVKLVQTQTPQVPTPRPASRQASPIGREEGDLVLDSPIEHENPVQDFPQDGPISQIVQNPVENAVGQVRMESNSVFCSLPSPNFQDLFLSGAINTSFWPQIPQPLNIRIYSDRFGQLEIDKWGETRYVGLGATVCIVDNCEGLRKRIQTGLVSKGYEPQESVLDTGSSSSPLNAPSPIGWLAGELPPTGLTAVLLERFFSNLHVLFPIISKSEFKEYYEGLEAYGEKGLQSLSLLYAILAAASPQLPPDDPVFSLSDCWRYQGIDLGSHFLALALSSIRSSPLSPTTSPTAQGDLQQSIRHSVLHTIMARALLSIHLTQAGMPREAWKMVSHAVRLGQDMGLHRSPCGFQLPAEQQTVRRRVWWCLYVMDRLLSMNLGRPLAIEDADCDVEIPSKSEVSSGFIAMVKLCQIIGQVLRISNSVANASRWINPNNYAELRSIVDGFTASLERWEGEAFPPELKLSTSGAAFIERCILLSSYYSTVILLFRPLMSNPHRESPLGTDRAMLKCFDASTACIQMANDYIQKGPVSHYLIIHGQTVFICIILLMHCIRLTEDEKTLRKAVDDCQEGIKALTGLEAVWPAARQCKAIAEEYLEFTLEVLERGNRGACSFDHHYSGGENAGLQQQTNQRMHVEAANGLSALCRAISHDEQSSIELARVDSIRKSPLLSSTNTAPRPCSFSLKMPTRIRV